MEVESLIIGKNAGLIVGGLLVVASLIIYFFPAFGWRSQVALRLSLRKFSDKELTGLKAKVVSYNKSAAIIAGVTGLFCVINGADFYFLPAYLIPMGLAAIGLHVYIIRPPYEEKDLD